MRNDSDVAGDINADLTIDGLLNAGISCDSAQDITINGTGTHTGDITIEGPYSHTIFINGSTTGTLKVGRDLEEDEMSGTIRSSGDMAYVRMNWRMSGAVDCGGDINLFQIWAGEVHSGHIIVAGNLGNEWNTSYMQGDLTIDGLLAGAQQIDGQAHVHRIKSRGPQ